MHIVQPRMIYELSRCRSFTQPVFIVMQNLVASAAHKDNDKGSEIARGYCCTMITLKLLPLIDAWVQQNNLPDEEATVCFQKKTKLNAIMINTNTKNSTPTHAQSIDIRESVCDSCKQKIYLSSWFDDERRMPHSCSAS